ncbi:MAG: sigma 54-interacting transcriptional regulator, partial [Bacteroidales bacterium]|nr:sigma 54-interacting transcriptional regulator [Bacteroidales bacterium]
MPNTDVLNVMNALHITGKSPLLMRALNAAIQAAPYDVTVLVTGENGTGKDFFYKILHNGSRRRFKKCIAVNCGGLPEGTIDSELFGHVKGAYTGAVGERQEDIYLLFRKFASDVANKYRMTEGIQLTDDAR